MALPPDSRIHFQCRFDVVPSISGVPIRDEVVKKIRNWIKRKENGFDDLIKSWFFLGGSKRCGQSHVETACEVGEGEPDAPEFWAVRYEHPCHQTPFRKWRTDIGVLLRKDGSLRVRLRLIHFLQPGFIGKEPVPPSITSPVIVKELATSRKWRCQVGAESIDLQPRRLNLYDIPGFKIRLQDPNRIIPLLVISTSKGSESDTLIDPAVAARKLAGATEVYVLPSTDDVFFKLQDHIPNPYRCINGMVRLYLPGVRFDREQDFRRHRFFTPEQIKAEGSESVIAQIAKGLARRVELTGNEVCDVEDVKSQGSHFALRRMKDALEKSASEQEILVLYRDCNRQLEADAVSKDNYIIALQGQLEEERRMGEIQEGAMDELRGELRKAEYRTKDAVTRRDEAERRLELAQRAIEVINDLDELPRDLLGVLDFAENIYKGRIVVTEEARLSAKISGLDPNSAWRAIREIALKLHPLYFDSQGQDIEVAFKNSSGFELTLRESSQTRSNKDLMRLRKRNYKGREILVEPHVKVGRDYRIHYCPFPDDRVLVIGHCGDHLSTAGTRRRK